MTPEDPLVFWTQRLVFATYVLAGVGAVQCGLMVLHALHFKHLDKIASAAKQSADTLAKVEGADLRVRAGIRVFDGTSNGIEKFGFGLELGLQNYGRVRATVTRHLVNWQICDGGVRMPPTPKFDESGLISDKGLVADPNDRTVDIWTPFVMTKRSDKSDVLDGRKKLYVYGWVEFRDILGTHPPVRFGRVYARRGDSSCEWMDEPDYNS